MKPVVLMEQPFSLQRYIGDCEIPQSNVLTDHTEKEFVSFFKYYVPFFTLAIYLLQGNIDD
jgi:peroxiredoxin